MKTKPSESSFLQISDDIESVDNIKVGKNHWAIAQLEKMPTAPPKDSFLQLNDDSGFNFKVGPKHLAIAQLEKMPTQPPVPESKTLLQFDDVNINEDHMNLLYRYSDGLANGDRDDDKEVEFEHDPSDPIVDFNGHTNAGYGARPDPVFDEGHFADNKIDSLFPGHFGTVPRADFIQMKNRHAK